MAPGPRIVISGNAPRISSSANVAITGAALPRAVRLNLSAVVFGGRAAYFNLASDSSLVLRVPFDLARSGISLEQQFQQARLLHELGIGPAVYGLAKPFNLPLAVAGPGTEQFKFGSPEARMGILMEKLDPAKGWVSQENLDPGALSFPVLEQMMVNLLESYAALLRAGYLQEDVQYLVNTRSGEVRIVGSGSVSQIDPERLGRFEIARLPELLQMVAASPRIFHARRSYQLAMNSPLRTGSLGTQPLLGREIQFSAFSPQLSEEAQISSLAAEMMSEGKGEVLSFETEEAFIQQGSDQPAKYVYILLSGECQVVVEGREGRMKMPLKSPLIGEIGALLQVPRTATVAAEPGAKLLRVAVDDFKAYLARHPRMETFVSSLISRRLAEQAEYFFRSERSVRNLFAGGDLSPSLEHPRGESSIPYQEMVRAYQRDGSRGLAGLVCRYVLKEAFSGNVVPLQHWMRVVQGRAAVSDALYIFEMFQTGQLHLHPTRSCTPELVDTPEQIEAMALDVARSQYQNNVRVMELRFSMDAKGGVPSERVLEAYVRGLERAEKELAGMKCRAIVIFDTVMSGAEANAQADMILEFAARHPELGRYVVGVDTAGPEVGRNRQDLPMLPGAERLGGKQTAAGQTEYYFDLHKFETAFGKLQDAGIRLTSHGGENFFTLEQGFDAVQARVEMGAVRIGHGVILGIDIDQYVQSLPQSAPGEHTDIFGQVYTRERIVALKERQADLLRLVVRKGIVVEACPDSNLHTGPLSYRLHPMRQMMHYGVKVAIANDNAVLDHTSGARQVFAIGRAQALNLRDITELILAGVTHTMDMLVVQPVKEDLKQPHQGEVIEVRIWDALQKLRALANDPAVSQFQFMHEALNCLTAAFPEVEASYLEVNGEVLFSRKTYTEKYALRMEEIEREYEGRFNALNRRFHDGTLGRKGYARERRQLKRKLALEKGAVLGGYGFPFRFAIEEGNRSFGIEMRFFASSRAAAPRAKLRKFYQKRFEEIFRTFIVQNIRMELPDPLTPMAVKSREWALFKLEPLADYYRKQGKGVSFGLFDADYFKYFNAGGNYLLGDDAIAVLNLAVERSIRVRDVIMPVRNGGDEVAVLFTDASPADAGRAIARTDRVLHLSTSIPLDGRVLSVDMPLEKNLVETANEVRAEIARKIAAGEFRFIRSVEEFNRVFCQPRLVSDVSLVGETLCLDEGKVKIRVDAAGKLRVEALDEVFEAQLEAGVPQKIALAGREYAIKMEEGSGRVYVYHEVTGMRISGGIGENMQEAAAAQMEAKSRGKGTVVLHKEAEKPAGQIPEEKPLRELNEEIYRNYAIVENIDRMMDAVESGEPALPAEEAQRLYLESYKQVFGKEVRISPYRVDVGEGEMEAAGSIRVGGRSIAVYAGSSNPFLKAAAREYTEQLSLVEQIRRNLHIIAQADRIDPLTALLNRKAFHKRVEEMLERVRESRRGEVSVFFFDMNDFKGFNHLLGYQGADGLVQIAADIASEAAARFLSGEYAFARLMGDEFAIAASDMPPGEFHSALLKINQALELILTTDPSQPLEGRGVDSEVLRAAEEIRPRILERVRAGEFRNFNFEMLQAAVTSKRRGRLGEVAGGVRFSGGVVVVSARDITRDVAVALIEQAGELAEAAKRKRKASRSGNTEIPLEYFKRGQAG